MCLTKVTKVYKEEDPGQKQWKYGFKVVRTNDNHNFYTPYQLILLEKFNKINEDKRNRLLIGEDSTYYQTGFHILRTLKAANAYRKVTDFHDVKHSVVKVKYSDVVAEGFTKARGRYFRIDVAKKMVMIKRIYGCSDIEEKHNMKFKEKVEKAKEKIKWLKEYDYDYFAEEAKKLLNFALFYANENKIHKAYYRLNKILEI